MSFIILRNEATSSDYSSLLSLVRGQKPDQLAIEYLPYIVWHKLLYIIAYSSRIISTGWRPFFSLTPLMQHKLFAIDST